MFFSQVLVCIGGCIGVTGGATLAAVWLGATGAGVGVSVGSGVDIGSGTGVGVITGSGATTGVAMDATGIGVGVVVEVTFGLCIIGFIAFWLAIICLRRSYSS